MGGKQNNHRDVSPTEYLHRTVYAETSWPAFLSASNSLACRSRSSNTASWACCAISDTAAKDDFKVCTSSLVNSASGATAWFETIACTPSNIISVIFFYYKNHETVRRIQYLALSLLPCYPLVTRLDSSTPRSWKKTTIILLLIKAVPKKLTFPRSCMCPLANWTGTRPVFAPLR